MDVVMLSRLQFAVTAGFHFIFVPLTLGLAILVAYMETKYVRTGDEMYLRMTKFWGKLFLINFVLGIVTGITLEFQFGMNWAEYSKYVGDIFGSLLAIEATVAFFLESTFIGIWIFGWKKVSKGLHAACMWIVAFASNLSALWILLANGWMQNPVGYVINNGRAEMVDFVALITNSYGIMKFFHTVLSGYVVAAFFVMGIAAWHILRKNEVRLFKTSFKMAAIFGLVAALLVFVTGDHHTQQVVKTQPAKFAAMESVWETQKAATYHLIVLPDEKNERNSFEALGIPKLMSLLAHHDAEAEVRGLKDIPSELRPPVTLTFVSFRTMAALGMLFMLLAFMAWLISRKDRLESWPKFMRIMVCVIPLPYIACQIGWIVAEVGRQPWIVYGVLKTSDAVSTAVTAGQVWMSLAGFTLLYGFLAAVDLYLIVKYAKLGPEAASAKEAPDSAPITGAKEA
jgi:cytochrome bd ubiquinol oxidase subunit I